jgi:hypothetical protein
MRAITLATALAPLLVGAWHHRTGWRTAPDACSLLTPSDVSTAIESTSLPGKRLFPTNPAFCMWSDSPINAVTNRRVTLEILKPNAYDVAKGSGNGTKVEPVAGIGDDAYYLESIKSSQPPYLYVRKGRTDFQVRILNGLNFKAFTLAQEKAKEADLAKAVAAKL